jgi:hypothetical protein
MIYCYSRGNYSFVLQFAVKYWEIFGSISTKLVLCRVIIITSQFAASTDLFSNGIDTSLYANTLFLVLCPEHFRECPDWGQMCVVLSKRVQRSWWLQTWACRAAESLGANRVLPSGFLSNEVNKAWFLKRAYVKESSTGHLQTIWREGCDGRPRIGQEHLQPLNRYVTTHALVVLSN